MADISIYGWLKGHDVFSWLQPLWEGGNWFLNKDGKLEPKFTQIAIDTPWIHHGHLDRTICFLGQLIFNNVSLRIKQYFADFAPFVPSSCQECYKVVVRPQTLVQLFALNDLEEELGLPSKCGIEMRGSVGALYGGYFYNRGLEKGRECYRKVRAAVDTDPNLGPDIPVILKRACTEMEHSTGPSDSWQISEEQLVIEKLVRECITFPEDEGEMPEPVVWRTQRNWIDWAHAHNDKTYLQFTDEPIVPGYVTYHDEGD